ncbi:MAG: hypothetical protein OEY52_05360, partial [Gammaproteobacteria bacterium]|nr:hypothetical protein [Gammaproteobacteria bacterium]
MNTLKWFVTIFTAALMLNILPVRAADNPLHRLVDGVDIYLGVIPAEMIKGHPRHHPEGTMHGGIPAGTHYHVMVALFDAKTGKRIDNASITASIKGAAAESRKTLEPMLVSGARTFGNYFTMGGY